MCTLSVIRPFDSAEGCAFGLAQGTLLWRVMFNRDEQRSRPVACPPTEHRHSHVGAVYPIDPLGGGTWIAATSERLVLALLNEYPRSAEPTAARVESRGRIIPHLVDARDAAEAQRRAQGLDLERFAPFRFVAIDDGAVREVVSDGRTLRVHPPVRGDRWMRTSSSIGSSVNQTIRTAAFDRLVTTRSRAAQERFHAYACADRPEAGVRMTRGDARTVSMTTIEVFADRVRMTYRPIISNTEVRATPERRIIA